MKLVLGSASPRRKEILEEMGYEFEVVAPDIDEKAIRDPDPEKLVLKLARAKADAVIKKLKEPAIVLAADSVVFFDGHIIEKADSKKHAKRILNDYGTEPIQHYTAIVVVNTATGKRLEDVDVVNFSFRPFSDRLINWAVDSGLVLDRAGALAVEGEFRSHLASIDGEVESVQGLPKALTKKLISEAEK